MKISKTLILTFLASFLFVAASAQNFRSLMRKADKQYELHAFNQAVDTYLQALERRRDDPEALGNLADCYRHLNEMMEARKYYTRAVAQNRVEARHILNYGHVLKAMGDYDEAKRWYLEYAKDDPMIGNHYAQTCDFAKSQQQLNTGLYVNNEQNINSSAADFGPAFRQGQVVFSSSRIDIQRTSTNDFSGQQPNQLYIARSGQEGMLENPFFLQNSSDKKQNIGPVSFSPEGRYIVYTKNNFVDGTRHIASSGMQLNLFFAEINATGDWINEQAFPYNAEGYSTGFPCFSPDGSAIYFASDRPDGFGGYDLYVSYRAGNSWGRPENLGPVINSPGNEMTPYFDGDNLFFSSDWHPGFGGLDLFRAQQMNNRWSQIFHIGNPVSSPRDDYGLVYDKLRNIGYFVSNREGGEGHEDLYSLSRPAENIILNVENASDGSPVANALVDFTDCGQGLVQTDDRGIYRLQAMEGMNCTVYIRKEGYMDRSIQLSSSGQQGTRQVEVPLVRRGEEYYGKILNYNTRTPVEGVTVIATNQMTGNTTRVVTDAKGDYTLALSPNSSYLIRYSRPGYRDVNRTVRTNQGTDSSLLGTISILPSDAPLPAGVTDPSQLIDPYQTENQQSQQGSGTQTYSGYAVQVAALKQPNMERFSDLEGMATLYSKQENGAHKIRLGVFQTKEEATQTLSNVKRKGYKGAFVVAEPGVELAARGSAEFVNNTENSGGRFKIQLGAYRNPRSFDSSKIDDLGYIEDKQKGNLTVKFLSGFSTAQQAKAALPQVRAAGFTGAYVVEEQNNGQMKRVQ